MNSYEQQIFGVPMNRWHVLAVASILAMLATEAIGLILPVREPQTMFCVIASAFLAMVSGYCFSIANHR